MMRDLWHSDIMLAIRKRIAAVRNCVDPIYIWRKLRRAKQIVAANAPYEREDKGIWYPQILGLEETLRKVIDKRMSLARYGDGEFELMAGRRMSFEVANSEMAGRLKDILKEPLPNCLNCVPNIFGSLERYRDTDKSYWRTAAVWMRPILRECMETLDNGGVAQNTILGDPQVSRAYLGVGDKAMAPKIFGLWKELFSGKDILIVEGRFSRLGVGNDLFDGAKSIKRIWCPANGAYAKYDEIKSTVLKHATKDTLIVMALGATATILAYDLAKLGYWAVDAGHVDVEYMWMKMGATNKIAIPGRYVNEALDGHEMVCVKGEAQKYNVVAEINA